MRLLSVFIDLWPMLSLRVSFLSLSAISMGFRIARFALRRASMDYGFLFFFIIYFYNICLCDYEIYPSLFYYLIYLCAPITD